MTEAYTSRKIFAETPNGEICVENHVMEKRRFGRTELNVSLLTFGCGAVGGLMTKGEASDQDRAVAWARDVGINHFDTAPLYGNGASETNLGRALGSNREDIILSTKVRLPETGEPNFADFIRNSLETSLSRLQQNHVDLFQLHNTLDSRNGTGITANRVIGEIVPEFIKLREEGKIRFLGFTAHGDTEGLHSLVKSGCFDTAQIFFNMLVPSAGESIPKGYPAHDYEKLLMAAAYNDMGSIGVRVLAGGALSGSDVRHPLGMQFVDPIGSSGSYQNDVKNALRFQSIVEAGGADTLPELAIRYVISNSSLSTTEIGIATLEELQKATEAVNKGPLSDEVLTEIRTIQTSLVDQ